MSTGGPGRLHPWSIGRYVGPSPFDLRPDPEVRNPVLTASDVDDVPASFVADPFLLHRDGRWHLFFEVMHAGTGRGVIGLATSDDARAWEYRGIVLEEPFHISYPHVFAHEGEVYMIPETIALGSLVIYRADPFPTGWRRMIYGIAGHGSDPTPFHSGGHWWILVGLPYVRQETLRLFHADRLGGPWFEHPCSPIVERDPRRARPAGRVLDLGGRLFRVAQDCVPSYGTAVRAFEILELTTGRYAERPATPEVILAPGDQPWNSRCIHHLDARPDGPGRWFAYVDGQGD